MKKVFILILLALTFIYSKTINNNTNEINESIRFRVIANSNSSEDMRLKEKVALNILNNYETIFLSQSLDDARNSIENNLDNINEEIEEVFKNEKYAKEYKVNYGLNYFPEKKYNDEIYEEGYYESLVITIGEGEGENYWCILFPSLCMIEDNIDATNTKYKFKIFELFNKF